MITSTFEEQLAKLIDIMPPHVNPGEGGATLPIRFNWGTREKLMEFMVLPENVSKTPLIWLIEAYDDEDSENETIIRKGAELIIATQSLGVSRFNPEIYATDYKDILNPIKNNLVKVLTSSGISDLKPAYKVFRAKDFNWRDAGKPGEGEDLVDIWNTIILRGDITFSDMHRCLNTVKF